MNDPKAPNLIPLLHFPFFFLNGLSGHFIPLLFRIFLSFFPSFNILSLSLSLYLWGEKHPYLFSPLISAPLTAHLTPYIQTLMTSTVFLATLLNPIIVRWLRLLNLGFHGWLLVRCLGCNILGYMPRPGWLFEIPSYLGGNRNITREGQSGTLGIFIIRYLYGRVETLI